MKIAFVNQPIGLFDLPPKGSIAIWIWEVARRLSRQHRVTVYALRGPRQPGIDKAEGVEVRRVRVVSQAPLLRRLVHRTQRLPSIRPTRKPGFASPLNFSSYVLEVALDLRRSDVDVIHVQNFSQFVPVIQALNPRARIVLHMHCEWATQLDEKMMARRLKHCDRIIGCSDHITGLIKQRFPHYAQRCVTVENGVNPLVFKRHERHATDGNQPMILFVGRISPEKAVHVLLEGFARIRRRRPEACLSLVGSNWQTPHQYLLDLDNRGELRTLRRFYVNGAHHKYRTYLEDSLSVEMRRHVVFEGFIAHEDLPRYYNRAHVLVNPSLSEAFGMSLVEAMACGVPVVATRVGGMPGVLEHGALGLLIEPCQPEALAEAIELLLDNPLLGDRLTEAAYSRVYQRFSWDRIVKNTLAVYEATENRGS